MRLGSYSASDLLYFVAGQLTLFVITHPAEEDRVEVFELINMRFLKHIRSIVDKQFRQYMIFFFACIPACKFSAVNCQCFYLSRLYIEWVFMC